MTLGQARAIREVEDVGRSAPAIKHEAEWASLVAAADALIAFTATKQAKAAAESDSLRSVVVDDEGDEEWVIGPASRFKETP